MQARDDDLSPRDAAKLAAYERLARLGQPPLSGIIGIPVIGTLIGQGLRLWHARSVLVTAREDALAGVSTQRLVWTVLLALGSAVFIAAVASLYGLLAAELPPGRLWIAQAAVAIACVLGLPYVIEALGLILGTLGHMVTGGRGSLHQRMNRFHRPVRNIFSPRR